MPGLQTEVPLQRGWGSLPNAEDQKFNTFRGGSSSAEGQGRRRCINIVLAILVVTLIAVVAAGMVSVRGGSSDGSKAVPAALPSDDTTNVVDDPSFSDTPAADAGEENAPDDAGSDTSNGDTTTETTTTNVVDDPSFSDTPAADAGEENAPDDAGSDTSNGDTTTDTTAPAPVPEPDFGSAEPDDGSYSMADFSMSTDQSMQFSASMSVPFSVSFSAGSVDFSGSFSLRRKERMLRKESTKKARRTKRMTQRMAHN